MNYRSLLLMALVVFSSVVAVTEKTRPVLSKDIAIPRSSSLLNDALPMTDFFIQQKFDYLVVIILENKNLNETYGSSCSGNCTYITQLADTYSSAMNYSGAAHKSLPNYLTLTSGRDYGYPPFSINCGVGGGPQVGNCTIASRNIVDGIEESHRTWKAYITWYGGGCSNAFIPFLYYTDVYYNSTRCSRIVNASPTHVGYYGLPTKLLSDLNSVSTAPNFMWLQPDAYESGYAVCNDTKILAPCATNSTNFGRCVSQSNHYLNQVVPLILDSPIFRTQNAALFITWDEGGAPGGDKICPNLGPTYPTCNDTIPAIIAGRYVKPNYVSNLSLSHYSFMKTLELVWNFDIDNPPITPSPPSQAPTTLEELAGLLRSQYMVFLLATAIATLTAIVLFARLRHRKSMETSATNLNQGHNNTSNSKGSLIRHYRSHI